MDQGPARPGVYVGGDDTDSEIGSSGSDLDNGSGPIPCLPLAVQASHMEREGEREEDREGERERLVPTRASFTLLEQGNDSSSDIDDFEDESNSEEGPLFIQRREGEGDGEDAEWGDALGLGVGMEREREREYMESEVVHNDTPGVVYAESSDTDGMDSEESSDVPVPVQKYVAPAPVSTPLPLGRCVSVVHLQGRANVPALTLNQPQFDTGTGQASAPSASGLGTKVARSSSLLVQQYLSKPLSGHADMDQFPVGLPPNYQPNMAFPAAPASSPDAMVASSLSMLRRGMDTGSGSVRGRTPGTVMGNVELESMALWMVEAAQTRGDADGAASGRLIAALACLERHGAADPESEGSDMCHLDRAQQYLEAVTQAQGDGIDTSSGGVPLDPSDSLMLLAWRHMALVHMRKGASFDALTCLDTAVSILTQKGRARALQQAKRRSGKIQPLPLISEEGEGHGERAPGRDRERERESRHRSVALGALGSLNKDKENKGAEGEREDLMPYLHMGSLQCDRAHLLLSLGRTVDAVQALLSAIKFDSVAFGPLLTPFLELAVQRCEAEGECAREGGLSLNIDMTDSDGEADFPACLSPSRTQRNLFDNATHTASDGVFGSMSPPPAPLDLSIYPDATWSPLERLLINTWSGEALPGLEEPPKRKLAPVLTLPQRVARALKVQHEGGVSDTSGTTCTTVRRSKAHGNRGISTGSEGEREGERDGLGVDDPDALSLVIQASPEGPDGTEGEGEGEGRGPDTSSLFGLPSPPSASVKASQVLPRSFLGDTLSLACRRLCSCLLSVACIVSPALSTGVPGETDPTLSLDPARAALRCTTLCQTLCLVYTTSSHPYVGQSLFVGRRLQRVVARLEHRLERGSHQPEAERERETERQTEKRRQREKTTSHSNTGVHLPLSGVPDSGIPQSEASSDWGNGSESSLSDWAARYDGSDSAWAEASDASGAVGLGLDLALHDMGMGMGGMDPDSYGLPGYPHQQAVADVSTSDSGTLSILPYTLQESERLTLSALGTVMESLPQMIGIESPQTGMDTGGSDPVRGMSVDQMQTGHQESPSPPHVASLLETLPQHFHPLIRAPADEGMPGQQTLAKAVRFTPRFSPAWVLAYVSIASRYMATGNRRRALSTIEELVKTSWSRLVTHTAGDVALFVDTCETLISVPTPLSPEALHMETHMIAALIHILRVGQGDTTEGERESTLRDTAERVRGQSRDWDAEGERESDIGVLLIEAVLEREREREMRREVERESLTDSGDRVDVPSVLSVPLIVAPSVRLAEIAAHLLVLGGETLGMSGHPDPEAYPEGEGVPSTPAVDASDEDSASEPSPAVPHEFSRLTGPCPVEYMYHRSGPSSEAVFSSHRRSVVGIHALSPPQGRSPQDAEPLWRNIPLWEARLVHHREAALALSVLTLAEMDMSPVTGEQLSGSPTLPDPSVLGETAYTTSETAAALLENGHLRCRALSICVRHLPWYAVVSPIASLALSLSLSAFSAGERERGDSAFSTHMYTTQYPSPYASGSIGGGMGVDAMEEGEGEGEGADPSGAALGGVLVLLRQGRECFPYEGAAAVSQDVLLALLLELSVGLEAKGHAASAVRTLLAASRVLEATLSDTTHTQSQDQDWASLPSKRRYHNDLVYICKRLAECAIACNMHEVAIGAYSTLLRHLCQSAPSEAAVMAQLIADQFLEINQHETAFEYLTLAGHLLQRERYGTGSDLGSERGQTRGRERERDRDMISERGSSDILHSHLSDTEAGTPQGVFDSAFYTLQLRKARLMLRADARGACDLMAGVLKCRIPAVRRIEALYIYAEALLRGPSLSRDEIVGTLKRLERDVLDRHGTSRAKWLQKTKLLAAQYYKLTHRYGTALSLIESAQREVPSLSDRAHMSYQKALCYVSMLGLSDAKHPVTLPLHLMAQFDQDMGRALILCNVLKETAEAPESPSHPRVREREAAMVEQKEEREREREREVRVLFEQSTIACHADLVGLALSALEHS
ncbi:hypothetical protein KIPB_002607, partial [Kipferlia bialata]|eukprot:g2607.t1